MKTKDVFLSKKEWALVAALVVGGVAGFVYAAHANVLEISQTCKTPCVMKWEQGYPPATHWDLTFEVKPDVWHFQAVLEQRKVVISERQLIGIDRPVRYRVRAVPVPSFETHWIPSSWSLPSLPLVSDAPRRTEWIVEGITSTSPVESP